MDKKLKFGGTFAYGDWCLDFSFRPFKVFRLHAILQDAAGAVRAHGGKGPDFCYMIGRAPNPGLLGHLTWQVFYLYVKLFLPSFSN